MKKRFLFTALVIVVSVYLSSSVFAARKAAVNSETDVFEKSNPNSQVIDTLSEGSSIKTSNFPRNGFYKVRTPGGKIGWVMEDALDFQSAPTKQERTKKREYKQMRIQGFGGMDFFTASEINNLFAINALKNGFYGGGEISYYILKDLALVLRGEKIFKFINMEDPSTGLLFALEISSMPFSGGIAYNLSQSDEMRIEFFLLGGVGVNTKAKSVANDYPAPNVTEINTSAIAITSKFELSWNLSKSFSFFVEGGYRYLSTAKITPTTEGYGFEIFTDSSGNYPPTAVSLSGPFAGLGISVYF